MIAHINIGSNKGNRAANISRAIDLLDNVVKVRKVSEMVSSAPWGYDSDSEFLNVGVNVETECTPAELLLRLQEIEREISPQGKHRDDAGIYQDREIDLDLIACGNEVIETPSLTLPHPRMHLRPFVLKPMAELFPQWLHPLSGLSCEEMLGDLQ